MTSSYSVLQSTQKAISRFADHLQGLRVANSLMTISIEIDNTITNEALAISNMRRISDSLTIFAEDIAIKGTYGIGHNRIKATQILSATSKLKNDLIEIYSLVKDTDEVPEIVKDSIKGLLFISSRIYILCVSEVDPALEIKNNPANNENTGAA
ncbi:MAG: hypothetical protein HOI53_08085 [Francisellaceae bacterium]|jgi:hypothetical protein|nr:hypothetical protein [Francisellaceae bacterium]MBT6207974.1 hypothetical protein [Francisellaceae bacterium]MBT6539098.1 hypothetical protein [Francisellaceae bacterium]